MILPLLHLPELPYPAGEMHHSNKLIFEILFHQSSSLSSCAAHGAVSHFQPIFTDGCQRRFAKFCSSCRRPLLGRFRSLVWHPNIFSPFSNFFSICFLKLLCVMISHWLTVLKHKMPSQILIKNSWIGLVNVVHLCTPECDRASRRIQQGEGASRGLLWAP